MRLVQSKSKNANSLYMVKSVYEDGKKSTKVVEKLGTVAELENKLDGRDPIEWAKEYIKQKTEEEKKGKREVIAKFSNSKRIPKGKKVKFNGGYLFLQAIYHELKLDKIAKEITKRHKYEYNFDAILSRLLYARVLYPTSKLSSYKASFKLIEQPDFELHQIYRALDVIEEETDFIQAELYKNSVKIVPRNAKILYYDCTNFFFEINLEDDLRKYGKGKDGKSKPLVQMGLFMDGNGIPLAFEITPGNTNEQPTLIPLEKKIMKDFDLSQIVVCTDAGLSSSQNRKFNNRGSRGFITTQSIKKLKKFLKDWALDPDGWSLFGSDKLYNIDEVDVKKYGQDTFYKERWIKENGLEQRLLVSFSFKYQKCQRNIREAQLMRAQKLIDTNSVKLNKCNDNDPKRFIEKVSIETGEVDEKCSYRIDGSKVNEEEKYDGFYGVCTNLEDDVHEIIKINHRRWEIEESFKIIKSEFKARPTHLSLEPHIIAHFATCFISLLMFRILEKKLDEKFTAYEIIDGLRDMDFYHIAGEGYIPLYERGDFTDALHESFGFRTDTEIVDLQDMKKNIKKTKKA